MNLQALNRSPVASDIDTLIAFVLVHTHLLFNKSAINVNKTVINGIRAVDDFDAFVIYVFLSSSVDLDGTQRNDAAATDATFFRMPYVKVTFTARRRSDVRFEL